MKPLPSFKIPQKQDWQKPIVGIAMLAAILYCLYRFW